MMVMIIYLFFLTISNSINHFIVFFFHIALAIFDTTITKMVIKLILIWFHNILIFKFFFLHLGHHHVSVMMMTMMTTMMIVVIIIKMIAVIRYRIQENHIVVVRKNIRIHCIYIYMAMHHYIVNHRLHYVMMKMMIIVMIPMKMNMKIQLSIILYRIN